jgi:hypothetical protein
MYSTENPCLILKFCIMKNLKPLFIVAIFSIVISSCTPQAMEGNPANYTDDIQATGDEYENTNDGTKD